MSPNNLPDKVMAGRAKTTGKIAILWQCFGPYHFARLGAVHDFGEGWSVRGLEISERSRTYAWARKQPDENGILTLFPGRIAEDVPSWKVYFRVLDVLKKEAIDVLFVPSYWPGYVLAATRAARRLGIPVVLMAESHYGSGNNTTLVVAVKRRLVRQYSASLVGGTAHRSFMRYLGMADSRIFTGYDVVDNSYFKKSASIVNAAPEEARRKHGLPKKYILSLGRFVEKKNLLTVVEAYYNVLCRDKEFSHHLVFVGSGPVKNLLVEAAVARGIRVVDHEQEGAAGEWESWNSAVHFYPFAQIDATPAYFTLASVFILASVSEEWGLVVNEAMACGCPVLVSRAVGSSLDLVIPGKTGYRFMPDNAMELAWCIDQVCAVPHHARLMGQAAARHIDDWSPTRFAASAIKAAMVCTGRGMALEEKKAAVRGLRVSLIQTCFPDYREGVFGLLRETVGEGFAVVSGRDYFTPDVRITSDHYDWHEMIENHFFFGRRLLWQSGVVGRGLDADIVVMELNPRILSNWVLLLVRRYAGTPTVVWGHAWGRGGQHARYQYRILRRIMMRLASRVLVYTHFQKAEIEQLFNRGKVIVAPNSLIAGADCASSAPNLEALDTILFVGRLHPMKKPHLLLQGFKIALQKLPSNIKLCYIGAGVELASLRAAAAALGDRVVFYGHVHNPDMLRKSYASAFASVSPGYVGLSAIQTFSHGVPLLLADVEPHSPEIEACIEEFNTIRFRAGDAASLAEKIVRVWEERELWLKRREEIARWTGANYSIEAMVEGWAEAVFDALHG